VLVAELLLNAVGPRLPTSPRTYEAGLVDRVAERIARVAAHDEAPVCAMKAERWPTLPRTTMSTPFIEIQQRAEASP
jgi:hypothetical protein